MKKVFLSVIIPFKDELQRLPKTLQNVIYYLNQNFENFEIILVDDGSIDGTANSIVQFLEPQKIYVITHDSNEGKGAAIRTGIKSAQGDVILFSDADLSTPIEEILKLMKPLEDGYDIVFGSRAMPSSQLSKKQPYIRQFIGKFGNLLIRLILGLKFNDTQCGFKLFKKDVAKDLFRSLKQKHWSFDYEILYKAKKKGYRMKEVGVKWVDSQPSRFHPFKDSISSFFDLIRIRLDIF